MEKVANALMKLVALHHRQSNSLTILMTKKAKDIELYLRKKYIPEGSRQILEICSHLRYVSQDVFPVIVLKIS